MPNIELNGAAEATVGPIRNALKAAALEQDNTLTGRQTYNGQTAHGVTTLTDGANIAWDLAEGNYAQVTLAGNRTLDNPSNIQPGLYVLQVVQDATGNRTLTLDTAYEVAGGGGITLGTSAAAVDVLVFVAVDTTTLRLVSHETF